MRRLGPAAVVAALVLAGCGSGGAGAGSGTTATSPPGTPATVPSSPPAPAATASPSPPGAVLPEGFPSVTATVTPPDGLGLLELCLWLAATAEDRQRGLMGVTSLGAADGMLFDFGGPTTGDFWMFQTVLPLSIAFFGADGAFVSSTDMDPCTASSSGDCARYAAAGPYAYAVEVVQGDLERLGLVDGSRLEVEASPGAACGAR